MLFLSLTRVKQVWSGRQWDRKGAAGTVLQHNASDRGVLCYDRKLADWKVGETDEGGHRAVFERPEKAFYWRGRDN